MPAPAVRIVAWGNSGRRDDGVGLALATELALTYADDPQLAVSQHHQLGPELVEELQACRRAIFIDAHVGRGKAVRIRRVEPGPLTLLSTHHCPPETLLSLGAALGMDMPESYVVSIRARELGLGDQLSEPAARDMAAAGEQVVRLIEEALGSGSSWSERCS